MTDDRIGRSMKKWVNMARRAYFFAARLLAAARLRAPAAAPGSTIFTGWPGTTLQHAVHHHAVARVQAAQDHDVLVAVVVADHHRPHLGGPVLLDHVDQVAVRALLHGELRHDDRVRPHARRALTRSRTCPGAARCFGFGSTARTRNEPVSWLNDGSAKLILPVCGIRRAVRSSTISTS